MKVVWEVFLLYHMNRMHIIRECIKLDSYRITSTFHINSCLDCLNDVGKIAHKVSLNAKEGMTKKGGQAPQKPSVAQPVSPNKDPPA